MDHANYCNEGRLVALGPNLQQNFFSKQYVIGRQKLMKLDCAFPNRRLPMIFFIYRACEVNKHKEVWPVSDISEKYFALLLDPIELSIIFYIPKKTVFLVPFFTQ